MFNFRKYLAAGLMCVWGMSLAGPSVETEPHKETLRTETGTMEFVNGLRTKTILNSGVTITYEYDERGRFQKAVYSTGQVHYALRDLAGVLQGIRSSDGRMLTIERKGRAVKVSLIGKSGNVQDLSAVFAKVRVAAAKAQSKFHPPAEGVIAEGCGGGWSDDDGSDPVGCDGGSDAGGDGGGAAGNSTDGDDGSYDDGMGDDEGEGEGAGEPWPPAPPPKPSPEAVAACLENICEPANAKMEDVCRSLPPSATKERAACWAAQNNWYGRCRASCSAIGDFPNP